MTRVEHAVSIRRHAVKPPVYASNAAFRARTASEGQQEPGQSQAHSRPCSRGGGRCATRVPPPTLHLPDSREPSNRGRELGGVRAHAYSPGQVRPRRRMVRFRGDVGVQGRTVRAQGGSDRPVRTHFAGVLELWCEGRSQAVARACLAMPGVRGVAGPGHQRGGQRREGGRTGRDSLWSERKTAHPGGG